MNLIVAVDNNWGIGYDGKLLYSIPEDMKFFREMTMGKVIVMGHSTLLSFPNSKPLKNRTNIVLSRDTSLSIEDVLVCNSLQDLANTLKNYDTNDVFVIGGESIYSQLLDYCECAYITKINSNSQADTFMVNLDECENWSMASATKDEYHDRLTYSFTKYLNNSTKYLK